jgi:hypothetical protein
MAEIRQVEHYTASIANKVGEGARVLGTLRDAGVDLIAVWGYPYGKGRAQLEFIPKDGAAFVAAAKQAKLRLRKSTALYIRGNDRPGAIADIRNSRGHASMWRQCKRSAMEEEATAQSCSCRQPLLAKLRASWARHRIARTSFHE